VVKNECKKEEKKQNEEVKKAAKDKPTKNIHSPKKKNDHRKHISSSRLKSSKALDIM